VMSATIPPSPANLAMTPDLGVSAVDRITGTNVIVVSGTVSDANHYVRVVDATTSTDFGVATMTGTSFSKTLTFTTGGSHVIQFNAVDPAANVSPDSFLNVFLDLAAPSATFQQIVPNPRYTAVTNIDVTFSEPINTNTVNASKFTLSRNGTNLPTPTVVHISNTQYRVTGLAAATTPPAVYTLTLNLAGIEDLSGQNGTNTVFVTWNHIFDGPVMTGPDSLTVEQGEDAVFTVIGTAGLPLAYQWYHNGELLGGKTQSSLTVSNAHPVDAGLYEVIASNPSGTATNSATLTVIADNSPPIIKLVSPANKTAFTETNQITIKGTATDDKLVNKVLYRLNGGSFTPALLSAVGPGKPTNWMADVTLQIGSNTLSAIAIDRGGNTSAPVNAVFFYHVSNIFHLTINGRGQVIPKPDAKIGTPTNNAYLFLGRGYSLTAVETNAPDMVLSNWTYSVDGGPVSELETNALKLDFVMRSNMHIFVNFITNPLAKYKGSYYGLFSQTNGITHHTAGFITAKVTDRFKMSGKLYLDGTAIPFGGRIRIDGIFTGRATPSDHSRSNLLLNIAVDLSGSEQLTGTIAAPAWTAQLLADRVHWTTNGPTPMPATAFAHAYTLAIPGFTNSADGPPGYGAATLSINLLGKVKAKSVGLADGSRFAPQAAYVSRDGYWPVWSPLYKLTNAPVLLNSGPGIRSENRGEIMGWLHFETNGLGNMAPNGDLVWIKTMQGSFTANYPAGFTNRTAVEGSRWLPVTNALTQRVMTNLTNALITLSDGDLGTNLSVSVIIRSNNTVMLPATNTSGITKASIVFKEGVFKGTFLHPVTTNSVKYQGVLLQDQNNGRGNFIDSVSGGTFTIDPE
jgi:hypothetical protein